jgi:acyl-coenzyme A thioesterase PaaI-like protein
MSALAGEGESEDPASAARVRSGLTSWVIDGAWRHTDVEIGPDACIEGTHRPLTGVLFAYLDAVTGSPPSGPMNPTVDLQIRLFAAPRPGTVRFRARTLRLGRLLYVGEAELRHRADERPFGVGVATFVNAPVPFPDRVPVASAARVDRLTYGPLRGPERIAPGTFEYAADLNTPQGTVGGAELGLLAELAARDVLAGDGPVALDELDVRFLNKVRVGPLRATASPLGRRDNATTVRIEIVDAGHDDRLVTYALAACRPLAT